MNHGILLSCPSITGESVLLAFFMWRRGELYRGRGQILNSIAIKKRGKSLLKKSVSLSQKVIILVTLLTHLAQPVKQCDYLTC